MIEVAASRSPAPPVLAWRGERQVAVYFGVVTLITGLGDPGGVASLPILFILKERLGQPPQAIALFEAIIFLPVCLGFAFGFIRDRWRPPGLGDRGYLLCAAPVAAGCYLWLGLGSLSYAKLLGAMLLVSLAYQLLDTAVDALMTVVAQRRLISGRLSALAEVVDTVPSVVAVLAGGWMASYASAHVVFLWAAGFTAAVAALAAWRPAAVFDHETDVGAAQEPGKQAIARLLRHQPLIPAVVVLALWNFSPGFVTPLFYYLTDGVGISAAALGLYRATGFVAVTAASLFYGVACRRQPLRRLLLWAVALNIFPGALFLLMTGAGAAIALASIFGLLAGFGNVAFFDLLRRSCPAGLEGMGTALGFSAFAVAGIAGDLLGAFVYEQVGFVPCLFLDAGATMLILPVLRYLPRRLADSRDGEPAGCD